MHNTVYKIGNKDLLHSTGNYTLYLIIEENLKKNIYIYIYIYASLVTQMVKASA